MLINYKNHPILSMMNSYVLNKPLKIMKYNDIVNNPSFVRKSVPVIDEVLDDDNFTIMLFDRNPNDFYMVHSSLNPDELSTTIKEISTNKQSKNCYFCFNTLLKLANKLSKIDYEWLYRLSPQNGVLHLKEYSMVYNIEATNEPDVKKFKIYIFYNFISLVGLEANGKLTKNGVEDLKHKGIKTRGLADEDSPMALTFPLLVLFFIEFAKVETYVTSPKNRKVKIDNEKYLNETPVSVEIIDSNYYTTTINNNKIDVEGHWRWQPYGKGRSLVDLIWIDDFVKDGYTRKAKIENQAG